MQKGISNESGAKIRMGYAKAIFNNKQLLRECLEYIAWQAKNVSQESKAKIARYLAELNDGS